MSYPADPSEVYELRRDVEQWKEAVKEISQKLRVEKARRKKAQRTAREYAVANAAAIRIIESLSNRGRVTVHAPLHVPPTPPGPVHVRGSE